MTTTTTFEYRLLNNVQIGDRLYVQEHAASLDCYCQRCLIHDDFGGCIVAEVMWSLIEAIAGRAFDPWAA